VTPTPLPPQIIDAADVEEQLVINVYARVSPAVVHITSRVIVRDFFWGAVPQEGTGSGFIIDKDGHVITNNHVVEGADRIVVTLSDETSVEADVVGTDPANDLAVLKITVPSDRLHPVQLGSSAALRVGQRAIAIGNPFGLDRTLTTGVISSLGRPLEVSDQRTVYDVIQTDAAINPGNSGGPLLDSQGEVIGVNTAIYSPTGGSVGVGFAIPVDTVRRVVASIIEKGYYPHPWLGITGLSVVPELAEALELPVERGVLIVEVTRGRPAAQAGVRGPDREVRLGNYVIPVGGDILTAIDGNKVREMEDLVKYLETETEVGQVVTLSLVRDGRELTIQVELGERP
jgi:S1-C subfamily serine protease